MGRERRPDRPDPGDDPSVQRNRMLLGFAGGPATVLVAAGLWLAGVRAVGLVLAALGIAMVGAGVDAAARRSPVAGTPAHARILFALAVLSVVIGLVPLTILPELLESGRRGAALAVAGPVAGGGVAWALVQRARRILRG